MDWVQLYALGAIRVLKVNAETAQLGRTLTRGVPCFLKGADTSINGVLDALNLILRFIRDPNCLSRNLTNFGLPTFKATSYLVC